MYKWEKIDCLFCSSLLKKNLCDPVIQTAKSADPVLSDKQSHAGVNPFDRPPPPFDLSEV